MACSADIYELSAQASQNRAPSNANSIMEFMVDCYTSMWQTILRNGKLFCVITNKRLVCNGMMNLNVFRLGWLQFNFFIVCYDSRTGRDSMLVNVFKNFSRKRFSQRTNDMRARGVLDFLAGITGSETADFLLFGRLIGLQPRQTAQPRPGECCRQLSLVSFL